MPLRGPVLVAIGVSMMLGLGYLAWALRLLRRSYRQLDSQAERRRVRIVSLGFAASVCALALLILAFFPDGGAQGSGVIWYGAGWGRVLYLALFAVTPVCITYAIFRHQVFDVRVIVRLGVRYAFARGIILSIVPVAGLVLVADVLVHRAETVADILRQRGLPYLVLAVGGLMLHLGRTRLLDALDRRFYREHYDAHRLLSAVVDDVRRAREFAEAARHVVERIEMALHPEFTAVMVRKTGDLAFRAVAGTRSPIAALPADSASSRRSARPGGRSKPRVAGRDRTRTRRMTDSSCCSARASSCSFPFRSAPAVRKRCSCSGRGVRMSRILAKTGSCCRRWLAAWGLCWNGQPA